MATFSIPNESGLARQTGIGDLSGEIWSSFNVDLHSNPGKIKLARPLKRTATSAQLGGDRVLAFASQGTAAQDNELFALTEQTLYTATGTFESWSSETASPARAEDAVIFQGQLVISNQDDLDAYDLTSTYTSDWWTARGNPALSSNNPTATVPRVLEVARIGAETLIALDGSEVHAYVGGIGSGAVTSVTMDIDAAMTASCFKSGIRSGWVGTYTRKNNEAYVYQWECASTDYTQSFPVGARAVLAMEMLDDIPLIVTDRGEIRLFNNVGFRTVARFPFANGTQFADQSTNPNNENRPIHPKGIARLGDTIFIYTNWHDPSTGLPLGERTPNGLWAFDINTFSLTHLCSPANNHHFDGQGACPIMVIDDENGRILTGGVLDSPADDEGIWMEDLDDASENYGYFVTTEIPSNSVSDALESAHIKALLDTGDEIVIKYRTSRDVDLPVTVVDVTWSGVTEKVFTSTDTGLATIKSRYDAGHRDEVEILNGQSAGRLCHITSVTYDAPTYTVTVDESLGVDGETSTVRFDNFKKIPTTMTSADGEHKKLGMAGENCTWHQLKVELRGKAGRPEVRQVISKTNNKETLR